MFEAERWIDGWSTSYAWRVTLAKGETTVNDMLENLKKLEEEQARYGYERPEVNWDSVERTLRQYSNE